MDAALNFLLVDILKNILSLSEKPAELGKYITAQLRELIGAEAVLLIQHQEQLNGCYHNFFGICPERKKQDYFNDNTERIAHLSHTMDKITVIEHSDMENPFHKEFKNFNGETSIIVPLIIGSSRIGIILLVNIFDIHNIQSVLSSLDFLSGVLALELRNAMMYQESENKVLERTRDLKESEEKFRKAFITSPDSLNINHLESGKYIAISSGFTKVLGFTEEEAIGKTTLELNMWTNMESRSKFMDAIKTKGHIENLEVGFRAKTGEIKQGLISAIIIELQGVPHILSITRDITERKRNEEELKRHRENLEELVKERTKKLEEQTSELKKSQQAMVYLVEDVNEARDEMKTLNEQIKASNKELEAFAYSVSHDLRAPLRAINGFTRILMEDYVEKLDDEGKRLGDIIQKNAQKMGKLIDDLLAFSRLGRTSMQFSGIDMKNMVHAIYHEASSSAERKRIEFSVAELPDAYGDTNMLSQVWMNLISNAIKFSSKREKAVISITSVQDDEKTTYRISDNGAGFEMQYVNKIFDVFQRLHTDKEFPGTGVGLSLVQRIIHRHNGKIWAESEVDKGATFYFSLPKKGINETNKL